MIFNLIICVMYFWHSNIISHPLLFSLIYKYIKIYYILYIILIKINTISFKLWKICNNYNKEYK